LREVSKHKDGAWKNMKMEASPSLSVSCKWRRMKVQVLIFGEKMVRNGGK